MRWKYCNYCLINGACENQDRGRECEMPIKKLCEENQQLKELLKECRDGLEKIKHIAEVKNLAAVYQVAERTLSKTNEVLK